MALAGASARRDGREEALLVVGVTGGSPAAAAGVLVGDVLLEFDGHAVASPEELLDLSASGSASGVRRHSRARCAAGAAVELGDHDSASGLKRLMQCPARRLGGRARAAAGASSIASIEVVGEFDSLADARAQDPDADADADAMLPSAVRVAGWVSVERGRRRRLRASR